MSAIERDHGLAADEEWAEKDVPADYRALLAEWDQGADDVTAATYRAFGEVEMADLFSRDRTTFNRRSETGRRFFFGTTAGARVRKEK